MIMVRKVLEDNTTINSRNVSDSKSINLNGEGGLSLSFENVDNCRDLNIVVEAKVDSNDPWTEFEVMEAVDLTDHQRNGLTEIFDVSDIEEARTSIRNNVSNSSTINVKANSTTL